MPGRVLGVDFGSSSTAAVLRWPDGRVRPLLFDGSPLLSSAVCADPRAGVLTGRDALHAARVAPERFEPNPKRRVDEGSVLLGEQTYPVAGLIAAVLRRVAEEAVRAGGGPVDELVLTHPVAWGGPRRELLLRAAALAQLPEPRLVPEPVAAAGYFVSVLGQSLPVGAGVLVYDLGAGTFDATAVRRTARGFEVLASEGLPDAGGLDIDAAILAHLRSAYAEHDFALLDQAAHRRERLQLWDNIRSAKEALSRLAGTVVPVPVLGVDAPLGRETLDGIAAPVVGRTLAATRATVAAFGTAPVPVFLVGGASRMPAVATGLHRLFGFPPVVIEQPELVVAEGSLYAIPAQTPAVPAPQPGQPTPAAPTGAAPAAGLAPASGAPVPGTAVSGTAVSGVAVSGVAVSGVAVSGVAVPGLPVSGGPTPAGPVAGVPVLSGPVVAVPVSGAPAQGMPAVGMPAMGMPAVGSPVPGGIVGQRVGQPVAPAGRLPGWGDRPVSSPLRRAGRPIALGLGLVVTVLLAPALGRAEGRDAVLFGVRAPASPTGLVACLVVLLLLGLRRPPALRLGRAEPPRPGTVLALAGWVGAGLVATLTLLAALLRAGAGWQNLSTREDPLTLQTLHGTGRVLLVAALAAGVAVVATALWLLSRRTSDDPLDFAGQRLAAAGLATGALLAVLLATHLVDLDHPGAGLPRDPLLYLVDEVFGATGAVAGVRAFGLFGVAVFAVVAVLLFAAVAVRAAVVVLPRRAANFVTGSGYGLGAALGVYLAAHAWYELRYWASAPDGPGPPGVLRAGYDAWAAGWPYLLGVLGLLAAAGVAWVLAGTGSAVRRVRRYRR